jgi:hypothetical protein
MDDIKNFDNENNKKDEKKSLISEPQEKAVSDIVSENPSSTVEKKDSDKDKTNGTPASLPSHFDVLTAAPNQPTGQEGAGSVLFNESPQKALNKLFVIAPILFFAVVGFVAAYFGGYMNFSFFGSTREQVIDKMFDSIGNIRSVKYSSQLSFKSEPRQPGAQPMDLSVVANSVNGNINILSERDSKRLNAIAKMELLLDSYKKKNGKFPLYLNDLASQTPELILDPVTKNQYGYRQEKNGMDFTLHVQMETDKGISDYRAAALTVPSAVLNTTENRLAEIHADTPRLTAITTKPDGPIVSSTLDQTAIFQNLPSEIDAIINFSGQAQIDNVNSDASFDVDGKLALGGMSFSAGLGLIKKGDAMYGEIKEAPSLGFFDLAALKGKWIKLQTSDLNKVGLKDSDKTLESINQQKTLLLVKTLLQILKEEKIFTVMSEMPKEKDKSGSMYHYVVKINNEKAAVIAERLNEEMKKQFGEKSSFIGEDLIKYLRSPEYVKMSQISEKNTQLDLWIDTKNFWPKKFTSSSVFVPPDSVQKLKEKQFRSSFAIILSNINEPVTISEPSSSISVEEAEKLVLGK